MNLRLKTTVAIAAFLATITFGQASFATSSKTPAKAAKIHYLEVVTPDMAATIKLYEGMLGVSFGPKVPEMGNARLAKKSDGTMIGIRKPVADHEKPIVRTYLAVEDIDKAAAKAKSLGATIGYPPTQQGTWGKFSIVILGDVQHGLWQR